MSYNRSVAGFEVQQSREYQNRMDLNAQYMNAINQRDHMQRRDSEKNFHDLK